MKTTIYAAFCGTGKTFICSQTDVNAIEIEYWKYEEKGLQENYVKDVEEAVGSVGYIFLNTNPEGLEMLKPKGFDIILVYPDNELRNEYLDRFIDRDSSCDFIGAFMKYWHVWINELKEQDQCNHIVMKSGEYLYDYLKNTPCEVCGTVGGGGIVRVGDMVFPGSYDTRRCPRCGTKEKP